MRAQAGDAKGQVVGEFLQQGGLFRADLQNVRRVEVQQAKGTVAVAITVLQRQADHTVEAVVQHALGPVGKVAFGADVLHDHGLARTHGHARRPPAVGVIGRPGKLQVFEVVLVVARVGYRLDGLAFVVQRKPHPAHAVAANVHGNLADGLQQRGFGGGAHQGFVAGAQKALRTAHAGQFALGAQAFGHVGGQHLACRAAIEADAASRDLHIHEAAVLLDVAADHWLVALVDRNRMQGLPDGCVPLGGPQVGHVHGQQLGLGVAVVGFHRLVHSLQAQRFLVVHPHGMGMLVEQHAVLLLRRLELPGHMPQLHHGPQGFGKDLQVRHVAPRERVGLVRRHLERAHHPLRRAQRHRHHGAHAMAVGQRSHVPALGLGVVAHHGAPFAQCGPEQALVHGQQVPHGPHMVACRGLRHQLVALQQLHQRAPGQRLAQHRVGHQLQHVGQGHVQRRDALLHMQQLGMVLRITLRVELGQLLYADVGHAAHHAHGLAGGVADQEAPVQHPGIRAVLPKKAVLGRPVVVGAINGCVDAVEDFLAVVGVQPQGPGGAVGGQLVQRHAEQVLHALVPPHGIGVQVPVPHSIGRGTRDQVKAFFAFAACLPRLVLDRDVLEGALDADDLAMGITRRLSCCAHPESPATRHGHLSLDVEGGAMVHAFIKGLLQVHPVGRGVQLQHLGQAAYAVGEPVGGSDLL